MLSYDQLVELFGEENIVRLDFEQALELGMSEHNALLLSHVGLPRQAGPTFTTELTGPPELFDVQILTEADGQSNSALYIGTTDNQDLRFFLDIRKGYVVLCTVNTEKPQYEVVNSSLSHFVHFTHEMTLRFTEEGLTPEEEREHTDVLAAALSERDPFAFRDERLYWPVTISQMKSYARSLS